MDPEQRRGARLLAGWVVGRAYLVLAVALPLGGQQDPRGDVRLYARWAHDLLAGRGLPTGDRSWQYPPGAAAVLALPRLTGLPYLAGFVVLLLLVDLAVLVAVARRRPGGAWLWVAGPVALGPVTLARFDLVPSALTVAGLLAGPRRARTGVAAAVGGLVKVWPLLLVVVAPTRRAVAAAAATVAVAVGVLLATGAGGGSFLGAQQGRGLQLEAVPAIPFVLARLAGGGTSASYAYGSYQFGGGAARAVATACTVTEVLVVVACAALWWRRGADADPADRLLALLLLLVVTSRVLSPQYLVWVLAVAACRAGGGGDRWRVGVLLVAAAGLSQLVYPLLYGDLLAGRLPVTLVLLARDAALIAATLYALRVATARPAPAAVAGTASPVRAPAAPRS